MGDIPRRIQLELLTPEELAIYNLTAEVEKLGAHPLLTDVVILLGQARDKLADWVELPTTVTQTPPAPADAQGTSAPTLPRSPN